MSKKIVKVKKKVCKDCPSLLEKSVSDVEPFDKILKGSLKVTCVEYSAGGKVVITGKAV